MFVLPSMIYKMIKSKFHLQWFTYVEFILSYGLTYTIILSHFQISYKLHWKNCWINTKIDHIKTAMNGMEIKSSTKHEWSNTGHKVVFTYSFLTRKTCERYETQLVNFSIRFQANWKSFESDYK